LSRQTLTIPFWKLVGLAQNVAFAASETNAERGSPDVASGKSLRGVNWLFAARKSVLAEAVEVESVEDVLALRPEQFR
jgi:hypothetical protein